MQSSKTDRSDIKKTFLPELASYRKDLKVVSKGPEVQVFWMALTIFVLSD